MTTSGASLVIFDIDGTLLLTGGSGARAFNLVFEELFGVTEAFEGISAHGKTDHGLIQEMMHNKLQRPSSSDEFKQIHTRYIEEFSKDILESPGFHLLPGVKKLLSELAALPNVLLGIESGNFEETGMMKLKRGGIDHLFSFGGYCREAEARADFLGRAIRRGEDILSAKSKSPTGVFVIGDSAQDIEAGKAHKATTVGVATGRLSVEQLLELGADYAFPNLQDSSKFIALVA
jgi:phosphoglycolate phosphatase-like HAD superfamily hydrolase